MRFSRELLLREAGSTGFRPEILEKVFQLLHLLRSLLSHPYLKNRILLKGGTALNFMFREPLFPFDVLDSKLTDSFQSSAVPVIDIHELAAGKFAALLSSQASRDLYDAHLMLSQCAFDIEKLRLAFVVYGAMNRKDWRNVSLADVTFDRQELENQLIPVLNQSIIADMDMQEWTEALETECRQALSILLPLTDNEVEFLTMINETGRIKPDLLTENIDLQEKISRQPLLKWKAQNVRQHRGI